jgi:hypothetical protein
MKIEFSKALRDALIHGTGVVKTTANGAVHVDLSAMTNDEADALRTKMMRDLLDQVTPVLPNWRNHMPTATVGGYSIAPRIATAFLLDASLRKQLMNGAVFTGVIMADPAHPDPVELSAYWLRTNGCSCSMCVRLRAECGITAAPAEVRPKDKRIDEMTHLDWRKCIDAYWDRRPK